MKKILVLGKDGQLGRAFQENANSGLWKFIGKDTINLAETETILGKLDREDFDILINAAAYTAVDLAEDEPEIAHKINAAALAPMAESCRQKGALLIHISTDYVFGEVEPAPIPEHHATRPFNEYGKSKLAGEKIIGSILDQHIIIRTSWLYGQHGKNFLTTMLNLGATQKDVQVVYDQVGSPTYVDHLAKAIIDILKIERPEYGIYHYSNEGVCSWFDFADAIFELCEMDTEVVPVSSKAFAAKARRPNYSVLDKQKIKDNFGISIPHWRKGLEACLHKMSRLK